MNAQEQNQLTTLLQNLDQAASQLTAAAKDADADRLIRQALADRPDIAYLLVQRHLLLAQALQSAQARIQSLEQTTRPTAGSFLGNGQPPAASTNAYGQPVGAHMVGSAPAPQAAAASPTPTPAGTSAGRGPGGGSFLGTAAAAATGVLGGALLFQGIEHLMGGGHEYQGGNDWAGASEPTGVTNITENFYGPDAAANPADTADSGWSNNAPTDTDGTLNSGFDDPAANPVDTQFASQDDNGFAPDLGDDSGGGFFDGLFGDGGDDGWL